MWYIIWDIENKIKHDVLGFATEAQALKYAKYYKSLLEIYNAGQHMQKRFGIKNKTLEKTNMRISFRLLRKQQKNKPEHQPTLESNFYPIDS